VRRALALLALSLGAIGGGCASCEVDDPIEPQGATSSAAGGGDGGAPPVLIGATTGGPPPPDAELCGNTVHDVAFDAPALYFVLDASGSMTESDGGDYTRYEVLRAAVVDLVGRLGDRARVGAALFPHDASDQDACRPGDEVFPVTLGDPPGEQEGPTTESFASAIDIEPAGGTPTAITLEAVRRALVSIAGDRAVILATDGGPNCNPDTTCEANTCIVNMEDGCPVGVTNCCDPAEGGTPLNCLDRAATLEAIGALRDEGVSVFVIGTAGSGTFSATLSQMAILGGGATEGPPYYYRADDLEALTAALASIAQVVGSCTFELDEPPGETYRTNVWLDADRLPYDVVDGWMWKGAPLDYVPAPPVDPSTSSASTAGGGGPGGGDVTAGTGGGGSGGGPGGSSAEGGGGGGGGPEVDTSAIELRGEACARFTTGQVRRVQIVTGCPTTTPN
jgi:hypothetical protein